MRWLKRIALSVLALLLLAIVAFFVFAPAYADRSMNPVTEHDPWPVSDAAQTLHDTLTVGDWHADSLMWNRDLLVRNDRGQVDLPRLIEGSVALQVFTTVTKSPRGLNYEENAADAPDDITLLAIGERWPIRTWTSLLERALYQGKKLRDFVARSDGQLRLIETKSDLDQLLTDRAAGEKAVGGLLGIEGAHPLEGNLANLTRLYDAGFRVIALQHFFDNELGGSLHGQNNAGLTDFGRAVVQTVAEGGFVLDIAHSSPQVVRDVLDMTDIPLILSHGGIYSNCPGPRNLPDDLMQEIAASGGVIGIGFWADPICDDSPAGVAAAIIAAVTLMGVDHVSLGSDFDGTVRTAFDTSELAALTSALRDAGMSDTDIAKVMGGNMVRVLRERLPD